MKKKICFIAQFPPPIHGLSKAVDTLYNSNLKYEFQFEKIDITNNKKFLNNLFKICKSKADLFYFTISQTKGGNLRDLVILKLLELQHKKCLIHLHGGYYRKLINNEISSIQQKANFNAIKKLNGVIVLSNSLRGIFRGMIEENKIYVVPNCVDNKFLISDSEFNEKIENLKNKEILHVLYLSNFIKSKGYEEVLKMAKAEKHRVLSGEKNKFHYDFAGKFFEESELQYFKEYIKENNLEDYITYHGVVGGDKKKKLLKKSDIFILITRYPKEGQPISILEAMGNGLYIITTDHAGIPDIVKNNENGKVLSKGESIDEIYICKDEIIKAAYKNRRLVMSNFREENYVNSLKKLFLK